MKRDMRMVVNLPPELELRELNHGVCDSRIGEDGDIASTEEVTSSHLGCNQMSINK